MKTTLILMRKTSGSWLRAVSSVVGDVRGDDSGGVGRVAWVDGVDGIDGFGRVDGVGG